jgi:Lrp/AsnC family leucine-responsive transcriptional regulator
MDGIDRDVVRWLQEDGRMSYRELGDRVGLSPNAVRDRVRALVHQGVIEGFHARVGAEHSERRLQALVDVRLRTPDAAEAFEELMRASPIVLEAMHLTGRADYVIRVGCSVTEELDDLIREMKGRGGVRDTETRLILRMVR